MDGWLSANIDSMINRYKVIKILLSIEASEELVHTLIEDIGEYTQKLLDDNCKGE